MRRWYIPVILVALAIFGVWTYHNYTDQAKATATVVVLAPIPAPGEFVAPQFGFDQIDESSELAARVAARLDDGTTAGQLEGKIKVSIRIDPNQRSSSPLYLVSGRDTDSDRAILIANLATEEAKALYTELNTFDRDDVRLAFQDAITGVEADVTSARAGLELFMRDNNAYSLPARSSQQLALVNQLELSNLIRGGDSASVSADNAPSLQEARAELARLTALEPEYNRLKFELDLAESGVARLESEISRIELVTGPGDDLSDVYAQLASEQARLTAAQNALGQFSSRNAVTNLSGAVQSQLAMVNQLVVSEATASDSADSIQKTLVSERAELDRLTALEPEYARLTLAVKTAEDTQIALERQVLSIVTDQTLPAQTQVKIFDSAKIESNVFFAVLTYALGVVLALLLAISMVYLSAQFEKLPPSTRELEQVFNIPVTAQVPRHTA
jgi:capsule polysaccharide export protein KpsE/RkpR